MIRGRITHQVAGWSVVILCLLGCLVGLLLTGCAAAPPVTIPTVAHLATVVVEEAPTGARVASGEEPRRLVNGDCRFQLQGDQNVVLVCDGVAVWATHTAKSGLPPPPPTPGSRTPDPQPGQSLPLPNEEAIIVDVASANPGAIANSCIDEGGSWEFMDLSVAALRATDTRWGYNCKRGDCGDLSIDVVNYFYGIGSELESQGSTEVYLIDIIGAVCPGGNQSPSWTDQTQATEEEGTIGRWIFPRP